jgi:peptidoglycan/LPS O-acetylase OafA/YrhL
MPALDGLRGVAVLLVIADHSGFLPEPSGSIGVTIFFVLSGFLITRVIVEAREAGGWSMRGFVAGRFVRLFPALALMVGAVSMVMLVRGFPVAAVAARAVPAVMYVENLAPRLSFPVFSHTWSLGIEEQFYLVWPLVLPLVLNRRRRLPDLMLLVAASLATAVLVAGDWLPMHAYALLCGSALAIKGAMPSPRWRLPIGTIALVVALVLGPHLPRIYVFGPILATPAAVLLVAGAANRAPILEVPALRFVGRISYALYLWHVPLFRLSGTTYARGPAVPWMLAAAVLAVASTLLLEEPLRSAWSAWSVSARRRSVVPTGLGRTIHGEPRRSLRDPRVRAPAAHRLLLRAVRLEVHAVRRHGVLGDRHG